MGRFDLRKGQRFTFAKDEELEHLRVELTWDSDADLDAEAFCLTNDGVIDNDFDFVYYKSNHRASAQKEGESDEEYMNRVAEEPYDRAKYGAKKLWMNATVLYSTDGSVIGSWDDPGSEDDDDENGETIRVDLSKVRPQISEIVFCVTIYNDAKAAQKVTFKDVPEAKITIFNADTDEELCSYTIAEKFTSEDAMVAGAVRLNDDGEWVFEAMGDGYDGGLETLVDIYS